MDPFTILSSRNKQYQKQTNTNNIFVIIVAFDSYSATNISRVLHRKDVEHRIVFPHEIPKMGYSHIILSGSKKHVYDSNSYKMPEWVLFSSCPVLGICYGMQLIAHTFGGSVIAMEEQEKGPVAVTEMVDGICSTHLKWMNRVDRVVSLPSKFDVTGITDNEHIAAFTDHVKWFAVQYHPEQLNYLDLETFDRFLKRHTHIACL
jgi:GMP synthase (glutamine-hydrolysing)